MFFFKKKETPQKAHSNLSIDAKIKILTWMQQQVIDHYEWAKSPFDSNKLYMKSCFSSKEEKDRFKKIDVTSWDLRKIEEIFLELLPTLKEMYLEMKNINPINIQKNSI